MSGATLFPRPHTSCICRPLFSLSVSSISRLGPYLFSGMYSESAYIHRPWGRSSFQLMQFTTVSVPETISPADFLLPGASSHKSDTPILSALLSLWPLYSPALAVVKFPLSHKTTPHHGDTPSSPTRTYRPPYLQILQILQDSSPIPSISLELGDPLKRS